MKPLYNDYYASQLWYVCIYKENYMNEAALGRFDLDTPSQKYIPECFDMKIAWFHGHLIVIMDVSTPQKNIYIETSLMSHGLVLQYW